MEHPEKIPFVKMHGTGNDFILIDNRNRYLNDEQIGNLAAKICHRRFGVGSDGFIALQFDERGEADLTMVYKNPDGSDAGMCGNGARCFASYAATLGAPECFTFRVHSNIYRAEAGSNRALIHFPLLTQVEELLIDEEPLLSVYTNTEHIVCHTNRENLNNLPDLIERGKHYRNHDYFQPLGTNVNFIHGVNSNSLSVQTYERGVEGLTYSCGTGAIASALAWHHLQQAPSGTFHYEVEVRGGTLTVFFSFENEAGQYDQISLEGPVKFVYEGSFYV